MRIAFFFILLFTFTICQGQYSNVSRLWDEQEVKADQLYEQNLYSKALDLYLEEKNNGGSSNELFLKIARCYYKMRTFDKALEYYEYPILRSSEDADYLPEDVYNYAETLVSLGRREEAQIFYDEYYASSKDEKTINRMDGIFYYDDFFKDKDAISVTKLELGSRESEIAVIPYKEGIFYSARADFSWPIDNDYLMGEIPTYGIYYSEYKKDSLKFKKGDYRPVSKGLFNVTSPAFLKDSIVIVSANKKRIPILSSDKNNYLKLYQAPVDGNMNWGKFEEAPIDFPGASLITPFANESGDTVYFASDNPTGQGGFDIYYIFIRDGQWSNPINMGTPINTSGDEIYPFFRNGTLFFSSNGHPGLGGYDVYIHRKGARKVINFGSPVNSSYDDFNLSLEPDKDNSGYFVSNREEFGIEGNDDIFKFVSNRKERAFLQVQVVFQYNQQIIPNANVLINSKQGDLVEKSFKTDVNGLVDVEVYMSNNYKVEVSAPDYFDYEYTYYIDQLNKNVKVALDRQFEINAQVKASDDDQPIENAKVLISNMDNGKVEEVVANLNGIFKYKSSPGARLIIEINAEAGFNYLIDTIAVDQPKWINTFYLDRVKMETITLSDLLYEFNKYVLSDEHVPTLDTLASKMIEFPEINVLILSHTDSKGDADYNFELSSKRAESVANYLINQGIEPYRIRSEGRGEMELLNNCSNGAECTEEEHSINRRTEILIFYNE